MPLYDSEWEKGKCGFKLIQYMSLAKPVVASPVGANIGIVIHGENGYLAKNTDEWRSYLAMLIRDRTLREQMGKRSHELVESKFSFDEASRLWLSIVLRDENSISTFKQAITC